MQSAIWHVRAACRFGCAKRADYMSATDTEAPKVSKVSVRREYAGNQNYGSEENVWNMWH